MELSKAYDPKTVEQDINARWLAAGSFNSEPDGHAGAYCIVIPPPNVTAALHVGHALNNGLQDVLIRFRRMQGRNTLWMPGTDHAGIATQTVVEKRLLAEEGKRRTDYNRDEFVKRVHAWKDQYEARILHQLQQMGCSCDWRRTRFTMDEVCAKAVRAAFFKLFADGLIYRGKRLVNWDVATQTVLADDEVEYEDVKGFFYYLRYPLVKSVDAEGQRVEHLTVATTRPETMLGDTAVAMNPADPRARYLVGKKVRLPIVGREIPIIADEHVVLPNPDSEDEKARFSTGFLKVTPAHDPDDYAIRERHNAAHPDSPIDIVNVLAPDGAISDKHGWTDWTQIKNTDVENLIGMDRFEAREAVVEWFRTEGLLEDMRDYTHPVGHSYRSHVPIEPYLSDQWYVAVKQPIAHCRLPVAEWRAAHPDLVETRANVTCLKGTDVPVDSLAGLALMPLLDGRLRFTPDRYANTYRAWLENLRDWPISRQLWWGHRIPIWSKDAPIAMDVAPAPVQGHECDARLVATLDRAVGADFDKTIGKYHVRYFLTALDHPDDRTLTRFHICLDRDDPDMVAWLERAGWKRDPDVLDTWFSSALWPFSTLGWPDTTPELKTFYPGNVLCTAREIITLWVSRMVMMGQHCAGDIPFSEVFIHAMIQDGEGRKMSKSLGNGIDPLDIIDSHGADALRFTLVSMTTQTQDVRLPVTEMTLPDGRKANTSPKFDIGRNFCNKLWNASRFALMNLAGMGSWQQIHPGKHLSDAWILSRLNATIRDVTAAIETFRFNELADTLYHFVWDDFCDWYLEIAKSRIVAGDATPRTILAYVLDNILRLLHPIMPFITEALWARLNEVAPFRGQGAQRAEPLLVRASWPRAEASRINPAAEGAFALLQQLIREVRNVRTRHNVPPGRRVDLLVEAAGQRGQLLRENADLLRSQAMLGEMTYADSAAAQPKDAATVALEGVKLHVLGIVDRQAETARLTKQRDLLVKGIRGIEGKLANEGFLAKAPPQLVQGERQRLQGLRAELAAVEESLRALG